MIIVFLMLVLEKNQVAGLASAKIRRINIRKGYKDYRKKLPTKAAIVVSRRGFILAIKLVVKLFLFQRIIKIENIPFHFP